MENIYTRTQGLIGFEKMEILKNSKVLIFGLGGVGGFVAESLVRAGIGRISLVDFDEVSISNLNRQIIALNSSIGMGKAQLILERSRDINPKGTFCAIESKVTEENIDDFNLDTFDFVVDAIDDVPAKIAIIGKAKSLNIPIISSMGTGNKLDPKLLKIADINQTRICPLARAVRRELKKQQITGVPVLYSEELPIKPNFEFLKEPSKPDSEFETLSHPPGSIAFVPATAGLLIGSYVFNYLLK